MKHLTRTIIGVLAISAGATALLADGHASEKALKDALKARQSHMSLYSFNLGALGAMAKGDAPYDAAAAQAAADNLATLANMSQAGYWLPGTDSDAMEGSRSLPAIWEEGSKAQALSVAFAEAATTMQSLAGTDLETLQGGMKALGDGCSACHEDYRKPR